MGEEVLQEPPKRLRGRMGNLHRASASGSCAMPPTPQLSFSFDSRKKKKKKLSEHKEKHQKAYPAVSVLEKQETTQYPSTEEGKEVLHATPDRHISEWQ